MGKQVLIVDDTATLRTILTRTVSSHGTASREGTEVAELELARDGKAGVAPIASSKFDLILSDVEMPMGRGSHALASMAEPMQVADAGAAEAPVAAASQVTLPEVRLQLDSRKPG